MFFRSFTVGWLMPGEAIDLMQLGVLHSAGRADLLPLEERTGEKECQEKFRLNVKHYC